MIYPPQEPSDIAARLDTIECKLAAIAAKLASSRRQWEHRPDGTVEVEVGMPGRDICDPATIPPKTVPRSIVFDRMESQPEWEVGKYENQPVRAKGIIPKITPPAWTGTEGRTDDLPVEPSVALDHPTKTHDEPIVGASPTQGDQNPNDWHADGLYERLRAVNQEEAYKRILRIRRELNRPNSPHHQGDNLDHTTKGASTTHTNPYSPLDGGELGDHREWEWEDIRRDGDGDNRGDSRGGIRGDNHASEGAVDLSHTRASSPIAPEHELWKSRRARAASNATALRTLANTLADWRRVRHDMSGLVCFVEDEAITKARTVLEMVANDLMDTAKKASGFNGGFPDLSSNGPQIGQAAAE